MNLKSQLSTKSLNKLKSKLPYGSITVIASKLNIDKSIVSKVLNGKIINQQVVEEALFLIQQNSDALKDLETKIEQL